MLRVAFHEDILRRGRRAAVIAVVCLASAIGGPVAAQGPLAPRGIKVRPASAEVQPVEELPRAALHNGMTLADAEQMALGANPALAQDIIRCIGRMVQESCVTGP